MSELPKTFDPAEIEARWYARWEGEGLFRPDRPDADPWTIVIPPPNVTGSLHIGHALDVTLQDILTRHARLKGKDALWVVGTDHAGIATQMVVERNLARENVTRASLGREAFTQRVWEWKAESGGQITRQLRRLGASCDWANERFTMDDGFSRAVIEAFVRLHEAGLLYRDKRLVNWDPHFRTAISDLEVETREVQGKFWHLAYPLADGSGHISVATTRPETMLADMAVAVNPSDDRYTHLVGKQIRLPITGRLIPIVTDEHADPELGSGAVKITPGHDFNDFEVGRRAGIEARDMLNMLDADARIIQTADGLVPDTLIGLDRFEARKAVVAQLEAEGTLERVEDRVIQTPYGDRSGVVIEPWLTDQWYVDAKTLAGPAIEAVRSGTIKVVPESWTKTYYNWMENIQPWCVSRQLWWGHRIPAWFAEDGRVFVARDEAQAQAQAGDGVALTRDPDVLDTWFSSALWPFGTLGWPEEGGKLPRHYPNDVLISGFDILFFWDARMIMQGLQMTGEVPFRTLYLHGLVRDATGAKMSKSKGNTVDPLGLIDRYGADALRFTLAAMESQGRDIKLDEKRVEGYRNFATKLWNASRFAQANGIGGSSGREPPAATGIVNQWIVAETQATVHRMDLAIADLRFDEAANTIYQFAWSRFCDWYLELIKGAVDEETRAVAGWVLDQILVMLHPFMPFVTEELWGLLGTRKTPLITADWPMADARAIDPAASADVKWLIRLVEEVRAARTEVNVPPAARTELMVLATARAGYTAGSAPPVPRDLIARIERLRLPLRRLARVDRAIFLNMGIEIDLETGEHLDVSRDGQGERTLGPQIVIDDMTFILPLEGVIDVGAERDRLAKALAAAAKERDALAGRLGNASFVERAKPEAVEKARADHDARAAEAERLEAALARLG
ncbi:valyl-tRNA synthetase [Sphingomonas jejuensis]|uniref:Valine--tRNA ligase n=1 Tax=Sphingomonas jejuensis TaxID=904715 RepID=A0ABX0XJ38_9SPHN|nr:valine--tRNA ligase [Sphingomonas jejuensis]NJC32750.1 valyl-tRNA synthetase [Sphingomonas jejuensis]